MLIKRSDQICMYCTVSDSTYYANIYIQYNTIHDWITNATYKQSVSTSSSCSFDYVIFCINCQDLMNAVLNTHVYSLLKHKAVIECVRLILKLWSISNNYFSLQWHSWKCFHSILNRLLCCHSTVFLEILLHHLTFTDTVIRPL